MSEMTTARQAAVLVVDDEPGIRVALQAQFAREGWQVRTASGVGAACAALEQSSYDLVVCDVRMGDGTGFEVLRAVRGVGLHGGEPAGFVFLTAYGSVPDAVEAMQGGAVDYLTKPVAFERVREVAARVMAARAAAGREGKSGTRATDGFGIVGRARALEEAMARARAAAATDADVLVEAESGTGKELLARMIHEASVRRGGPFVAINCAALPETLLESELFGHARGAFTGATAAKAGKFEMASGGTLLLDEIGDMPLSLQPKLLRVLQERVVERLGETRPIRTNIRVIATTNVRLREMVDQGQFRSDLFYRLNVIPLTMPPLRERMEDVPLLAEHFARRFAERHGRPVARLEPEFLERLAGHAWPGNVRELGNFMERVLSLHGGERVGAECWDREHGTGLRRASVRVMPAPAAAVETAVVSMDELERVHLERTLEMVEGNRTRAAEMLGLSVRTIRNKIRQYDLPPRRYA